MRVSAFSQQCVVLVGSRAVANRLNCDGEFAGGCDAGSTCELSGSRQSVALSPDKLRWFPGGGTQAGGMLEMPRVGVKAEISPIRLRSLAPGLARISGGRLTAYFDRLAKR